MNDVISNPGLQGRFDVFPIFKQFAYNMGITNTKDFEIKTKVLPDEQIQQLTDKGNIAPINQVAPMGGRNGRQAA